MKQVWLGIFLCYGALLFGQKTLFSGQVLDRDTGAPVIFANISFLNSEKGVSTDQKGRFSIKIPSALMASQVHISNLNYQDTLMKATAMQEKIVYLRPKIEQLEEVVVQALESKEVELDRPKGAITSLHSQGLRMIAKYFPNTRLNDCCSIIDKVEVFFPDRKNKKSKFRFRIFDKDPETGLPKDDLLKISIPVEVTEATRHIALDLSNYLIEMPADGFFVAFEKLLIPYNAYKKNPKLEDSEVFYSPVLGWSKSRVFKNTTRNFLFVKGKWVSLAKLNRGRGRGYVPAISVTLTN